MKATGIVRRIDDLGRVVIPKEIRKTMRIREGDPLEIYTDRDGEVIFKKYSPIGEMQIFAAEYAETLAKTAAMPIFVCDRDAIIAVAGASKREYLDRKISKGLEQIIETRSLYKRDLLFYFNYVLCKRRPPKISAVYRFNIFHRLFIGKNCYTG